MFNLKGLSLLLLVSLISVSCASKHSRMSGSVAMKINDTKGVACLFGENPKAGDKLELFQNDCSSGPVKGRGRDGADAVSCKMVRSGEATITKLLNEHYAEFETKSNVSFDEGYIIELSK